MLGLTAAELGRQVRQGFYGEEVQRVQRDREDVRIMVRYPDNERISLGNLETMRIRAPNGGQVPISEVADIEAGGRAFLHHPDRRPTRHQYSSRRQQGDCRRDRNQPRNSTRKRVLWRKFWRNIRGSFRSSQARPRILRIPSR